jgi:3-hydroxyacyl-CoA dehydrogenase
VTDIVRFTKEDRIGIISTNNPPVNALSQSVRQGLLSALREALADPRVGIILLICEGRTFFAGADISEFSKPPLPPHLVDVLEAFEKSSKPVLAAVHGTALGGGLETALACHYRCALPSAKVGLPEVKLGLIPGAGGTQRLPRLMGIRDALGRIVSGEPLGAGEAHRAGVIDVIIEEGDLREGAMSYARRLLDDGAPLRRTGEVKLDPTSVPKGFYDQFRKEIAKRTRGQYAPERAILAVEAASTLPFAAGMAKEQELFTACLQSAESAALRHVFFAERQAAKIPDVPKETPMRTIGTVGVIGAGTMGGGIAMSLANAGLSVLLVDADRGALDRGLAAVQGNYSGTVRKGRLNQAEMDRRLARISPTLAYSDLKEVDLAIEAVFEDLDLKKGVFGKLDSVLKDGAILASNTSYLDINALANATSRPGDVLGLHFFSPAHVMRLLEVVRGEATHKEVLATCMQLAKSLRKLPVVTGVCLGFIGNRMLNGYLREARHAAHLGAPIERIDAVLYDFGMSMGPFAVSDLAGLDVGYRARRAIPGLAEAEHRDAVADRLVEMGRLGQKSGRGFYRYEEGSRTPVPDPEVERLIREEADRLEIRRREIGDEEIVSRCLCALVNEGARILEDGIALRASDIDLVWINGYGFPPYRGGPMFHAEQLGVKKVYETIRDFHVETGADHWKPASLLEGLASTGGSLLRPSAC